MNKERRNSYRCAVMPGKDQAILHVGRQRIKVKLIDESAGGFSISVPQDLTCAMGDRIQLEVESNLFEVLVVHCTNQESDKRIGLQRIAALANNTGKNNQKGGLSNIRGKILVGTALFLPMILTVLGIFPGQKHSPAFARTHYSGNASLGPIGQFWRGVKGLDSLHDPQVASKLSLDEDQCANIDYVYYEASIMLEALYNEVGEKSPQAWQNGSTQAIELAVQRVVNNMTEEQVDQWISLLRDPSR